MLGKRNVRVVYYYRLCCFLFLVNQVWYHGSLSRHDAEAVLLNVLPAAFAFRYYKYSVI